MITRILLALLVLAASAGAAAGPEWILPVLALGIAGPVRRRHRALEVACVGVFVLVALFAITGGRFPFLLLLLPAALRALRRPNPTRSLRTARDAMILAMAVLSFLHTRESLGGAIAATLILAALLPRLHAERIARFDGSPAPSPHGAGWGVPAVAAAAALVFLLLTATMDRGEPTPGEGARALASNRARPGGAGGGADAILSGAATKSVSIGDIGRLQRDLRPILEITVLRGGKPAAAEDLGPLFRSGALEDFDGTTWESRGGRSMPLQGTGPGGLVRLPLRRLPAGETIEQRLRFLSGGSDALFCLGMPTAVGGDGAKAGVLLVPRGEIRTRDNYPDGAQFTIRSVAVPGEYAPVDDEDLLPLARYDRLRTVPPGHDRASALARTELMGGSTGLMGRPLLRRLETFLARRCRYSLDIAPAGAATPVEAFLFDSRRGHCELFASAAAVMLRSLGVPARVVVGFRGGLYDEAAHRYTLRGADAHAWVEAWFEETGWVSFDPTPSAEPTRTDAPEAAAGAAGPAVKATTFLDRILRFDAASRRKLISDAGDLVGGVVRNTFLAPDGSVRRWVLGVLSLAAALLLAARALRRRPVLPEAAAPSARPPAPVPEAWTLLLERLAAMGLRRRPSETGLEFVHRAVAAGIEPPESLDRLAAAYAAERFGARTPSDAARSELRALAEGVLRRSPGAP